MAKIENTLECVQALMKSMSENGAKSLKIKDKELEIELEMDCGTAPVYVGNSIPSYSAPAQAPAIENAPATQTPSKPLGNVVKAPIVGTFYASASPKDKPFVSVGQSVKKGDILFIIESMKVMNEIKSDFDGSVITINCKNGEAVEFDQPVMIIE